MKYLPADILDELEMVKKENGINKDALAFKEMADYCKVGRAIEKIGRFGIPRIRPPRRGLF